ncbi:hypothetical protein [Asticcacaulis taihuensis]|uniref:Uncharacterized protein n=1 Tax=Asticcacaulis taihuensis TaxID=260084 RepID=A0A1G4SQK5_9CAUL|nr:hypothetical protein [Asticcacaulis taihuensis]SCW71482.1 hypothetical protein SAMN02927928_2842 [Asticcacaulis taihuensis]
MTEPGEDVHKDLAFLKALVSEGPKAQGAAGIVFLTAGLAYGLDCLAYWAQGAFGWPQSALINWTLILFPIVVSVPVIIYVSWQSRKNGEQGVATRALNAAYGSAGLANLAIAIVFGYVASTQKNMLIWLLYPVVICAFLGAVWYVAYMIRRKLWLVGVSAGWFVTTVTLGLLIRQTQTYLLILGIALILLMGGSGWMMMALDRRQKGGDA